LNALAASAAALLPALVAALVAAVLLIFLIRRLVFLVAAVWPRRPDPAGASDGALALVQVLVPCRDEAGVLPGLLAALDALDYPRDRLRVVIVNDASRDATPELVSAWAAARPWGQLLSLSENRGKAAALSAALSAALRAGDLHAGDHDTIVWIYDADHRPRPDSLRRAVACFRDRRVGAVSGLVLPANGLASLPAYYATVEALVHQRITLQAKDRLGLAPPLLGANCGYRLSALEACGGFAPGLLLEDSDLSIALARAGWCTRFVPEAVSLHQAPQSLAGYWRQHLRWSRGFHQVAGRHLGGLLRDGRLAPWLRLELALFALGYLDRLALAAATILLAADALAGRGIFGLPWALWLAYLAVPCLQAAAALALQRAPAGYFWRLPAVPAFFAVDVAMAAHSAAASLLRRPLRWAPTERATEPSTPGPVTSGLSTPGPSSAGPTTSGAGLGGHTGKG
jgi:cellulose synthase/poly-beta-1,6-N-acetylglucosamine synthase-like glycosyltransferase